jgi:hypothetical protein
MQHGFLLTAAALALTFASAPAPAASEDSATIPPVSQRYLAADAGGETPDFQKHVTPLLGKLGCNGLRLPRLLPGTRRLPSVTLRLRLQNRPRRTLRSH